jgi:hypothetical protein
LLTDRRSWLAVLMNGNLERCARSGYSVLRPRKRLPQSLGEVEWFAESQRASVASHLYSPLLGGYVGLRKEQ